MRGVDLSTVSLDRVLGRARDVDGCLEWTGALGNGQFPQIRVCGKLFPVRRVVWALVHRPIGPKTWVGNTCGNPLCVHPDHLVARSRSAAFKGKRKSLLQKAKIAETKRRRSPITIEIVREIRSSTERNIDLAKRFGISQGYISHLRRASVWQEYVTPFQGIGGR